MTSNGALQAVKRLYSRAQGGAYRQPRSPGQWAAADLPRRGDQDLRPSCSMPTSTTGYGCSLGTTTTTGDADGEDTRASRSLPEQPGPASRLEALSWPPCAVRIEQVPPMYSALKRYKASTALRAWHARAIEVERAPRTRHDSPAHLARCCATRPRSRSTSTVHCSKGTYVRTLGRGDLVQGARLRRPRHRVAAYRRRVRTNRTAWRRWSTLDGHSRPKRSRAAQALDRAAAADRLRPSATWPRVRTLRATPPTTCARARPVLVPACADLGAGCCLLRPRLERFVGVGAGPGGWQGGPEKIVQGERKCVEATAAGNRILSTGIVPQKNVRHQVVIAQWRARARIRDSRERVVKSNSGALLDGTQHCSKRSAQSGQSSMPTSGQRHRVPRGAGRIADPNAFLRASPSHFSRRTSTIMHSRQGLLRLGQPAAQAFGLSSRVRTSNVIVRLISRLGLRR